MKIKKLAARLLHIINQYHRKMRLIGDNLAKRINKIENNLDDFVVNPISSLGNWAEFPEPIEYTNANTINVINTNVDLTKFFAVGDLLRLKQGGNFKYFYVYEVNANDIKISAGSSYTLVNTTITDVGIGIKNPATGFPGVFEFTPNLAEFGGGGSLTNISYLQNEFSVIGVNVEIKFTVQFDVVGSGVITDLQFDLPIPAYNYGSSGAIITGTGLGLGNSFTPLPLYGYLSSGGDFSKMELSIFEDNWQSISQSANGTYTYRIANT